MPTTATAASSVGVSACLVVRNEEPVIARCLESLRGVADEIIMVHDGPCEDLTLAIAERFACRVFVKPLVGNPEYHTVFAYQQALGQWLLTLDADEFLSPEMATIIPKLIHDDTHAGWEFRWPMWNGERYITQRGPYKLSLFRRCDTSLIGLLQSSEKVRGRVGRREETLHHKPLYDNFTLQSAFTKWRHWCRVQARELVNPFSELPKFNYVGPNSWPRRRQVMNVLSPVLALPNGIAHCILLMVSALREGTDVNLRLAIYQGIYATMLQLYVARYMYVERPVERVRRPRDRRRQTRAREWPEN